MASQYTAYLTKFGRSLLSGSSRLLRFLSHRLLSQKRAILVLGAEDSPIFTRLHAQLFPAWDFVFLTENGKVEEQASV